MLGDSLGVASLVAQAATHVAGEAEKERAEPFP